VARRRSPLVPLLLAVAGALALALTGVLALAVPAAHERDAAVLHGFVALDGPRVHDLVRMVAGLADPPVYAAFGLAIVAVALGRGLGARAVAVVALLTVTGVCSQALKQLLAQPRFEAWLGSEQIGEASWPSGHATAAMTLGLCAVLVAPPAARLGVALCGGAYAAAVGYAVVVLGWHFPSDVLAGFLLAGTWTALAVAALRVVERRSPAERGSWRWQRPWAAAGVAAVAALAAAIVSAAHRDEVTLYASERPTLIVAALAIAALAGALAAGLARAA
jgi:membrane-associated phospholipid phosphatase